MHPPEFLARVVTHIPDPGQVMQRYDGWYASRSRGTRRRQASDAGASRRRRWSGTERARPWNRASGPMMRSSSGHWPRSTGGTRPRRSCTGWSRKRGRRICARTCWRWGMPPWAGLTPPSTTWSGRTRPARLA
ncbi:MAG: transposase [Chloroflexi bacterium]|nr:transposase [Chloroflexota bacterium]